MEAFALPRVLVVDDNAAMRMLATQLFESAGAHVFEAESGEAALDLARRERFSVIVSDVVMPRIDGFQLAKTLRELPELSSTSIVLVSTVFVNAQDRAVGTQMGADLSVAGPLTQNVAEDILRKAVSGTLRRREEGGDSAVATTTRARERGLTSVNAITDALARSQMLFEAAFRASAWPQLLVDQDDIVRTANQAASALIGLSESQLVGTRFVDLVPTAHRAAASRAASLWRELDARVELVVRGPQGEGIPVSVSSARLVAPSGEWQTIVQLEDLTLRREHELALAQSEARFRAAFEAAPQGEALLDPSGRILLANEALGRMLGVSPESLRGRDLFEFIPPGERAEVAGVIERARTGATDHGRSQTRFLGQDGVARTGIVTSALLPGRLDPVLVQVTDVTRERQAVDELRAREASLAALFDGSPIAMAAGALDGTIQHVNHAFTQLTGYDDVALHGKDLSFLLGPLAAWSRPLGDPQVAHKELFGLECDVTCSDGARKRVVATGTQTSSFTQPSILMHLEDVTERRKAEAESARRARDAEHIADLQRRALAALDFETFLSHATQLVQSALEASSARVELDAAAAPEAARAGSLRVAIPVTGGPVGTLVVEGPRGRVWQLDDREFAASAAVVIGATAERIRSEETLRRSEHLSGLGTLVAGLAHEINNPLMYIRGNIELLQMALDESILLPGSPANAKTRDSLSEGLLAALKGLDRIGAITSSMRQLARSTNGPRQDESLAAIVRNVLSVTDARLKHDEVTADLEDMVGCVNASEIAQVVLNLIFNAGDATEGRPDARVRVRLYRDGPDAVIEVEDNGPGIPAEAQRRMFTPFFTTKATGTGLGLSLGRRIAKDHGGDLRFVTSSRGATFMLRLPAAPPEGGMQPQTKAI